MNRRKKNLIQLKIKKINFVEKNLNHVLSVTHEIEANARSMYRKLNLPFNQLNYSPRQYAPLLISSDE